VFLGTEDSAAHHPPVPAITTAAAPHDDAMMIDPKNQAVEVLGGKKNHGMRTRRRETMKG